MPAFFLNTSIYNANNRTLTGLYGEGVVRVRKLVSSCEGADFDAVTGAGLEGPIAESMFIGVAILIPDCVILH